MLLKAARLTALLTLLLLTLHLVAAQNPPPPPSSSVQPSASVKPSDAPTPSPRPDSHGETSAATQRPSTTNSTSESTVSYSSEVHPTATRAPIGDPKFINATIPAGQLPLPPELTPGWGVAGVILLTTGMTYALVGIKNRWIHTFFSTSYITALGVSVLIIYVMNVPVSHAVQGGYVVAVIVSGCAVGGASMFFKELTEGLGCALGGFCLSMWLLCLVPGGMLRTVPAKAIFNASFTLVGFALYFSRWTRDWTLIFTLAFSGATATILGLDCFSRAGLKEFWAYVWDVNNNLFPVGADTYPVTKGIRVETAAVVIICIMGIISQIKLWRIVRDKRAKRAVERAEGRRNLELEEENVGRQVEEANARDRRHWEQVYGNDTVVGTDSRMSDLGDMTSEKKVPDGSFKQRSSVEVIEMADMSESDLSRAAKNPLMTAAEDAEDGKVMVRVGSDDHDQDDDGAGVEKRVLERSSASKRASMAPEVVPLPFNVPPAPTPDADQGSEGDRSSIATYAADDAEKPSAANGNNRSGGRASLAKRSFDLLKGRASPRGGGEEVSERHLVGKTRRHDDDDDDGSLAATVDEASSSEGDDEGRRSSVCNDDDVAELPGEEARSRGPASDGGKKLRKVSGPGGGGGADVYPAVPPSEKPKSIASVVSTSVNLTKDRLPHRMSRVAMSYRTNEWAKHLGYAETPDPDELHLGSRSDAAAATGTGTAAAAEAAAAAPTAAIESSVPVNVVELQKTAEDGAPAPAVIRSDSRASDRSYVASVSRRASRRGCASPTLVTPEKEVISPGRVRSPGVPTVSPPPRRPSSKFQERGAIPEEGTAPPSIDTVQRNSLPIPSMASYINPQTLMGQREMFLRSKSQGSLFGVAAAQDPTTADNGSSPYGGASSPVGAGQDADDVPLSQRKDFMRQSSVANLGQASSSYTMLPALASSESVENLAFNSHQPRRSLLTSSPAAREAQLANFRHSVQQDLRSGSPIMSAPVRETVFTPVSLGNRESEVQRNIEMQRNVLMGQKEAQAQRKEAHRREREFADRAFDERMRSGDLLEAHREAMRRMQKEARD
ncbi:sulfite exporter TauE/SafE family protein [Ophiocordyceps camponoti-floridani]|uniref:Sulfite exporter TauE/SafE family protein n=1 Tax=Ophiocordyceps camponoti-floridani TaxID=2030778 RepID=A0A8H4Q4S6_9HYPO|nr:sulfite exporter TauE/SafE family protein [Ophiocordyceps camponoti-floridani]